MKNLLVALVFILGYTSITAQEKDLPYYEIPEAPEQFTPGTVAARMIDGLGFRYYWATEGLREEDLSYRPNEDARATQETIDHIFGLSEVIVNATLNKPNVSGTPKEELTFAEMRERTLYNFKTAADILRLSDDISTFETVFSSDRGENKFPFWNQINGPIADALWHCGQVVLLRRSSGNPFNPNVSVFSGKLRNQ